MDLLGTFRPTGADLEDFEQAAEELIEIASGSSETGTQQNPFEAGTQRKLWLEKRQRRASLSRITRLLSPSDPQPDGHRGDRVVGRHRRQGIVELAEPVPVQEASSLPCSVNHVQVRLVSEGRCAVCPNALGSKGLEPKKGCKRLGAHDLGQAVRSSLN